MEKEVSYTDEQMYQYYKRYPKIREYIDAYCKRDGMMPLYAFRTKMCQAYVQDVMSKEEPDRYELAKEFQVTGCGGSSSC